MSGAGYWVTISRGGAPTGAGFLLAGSYVLTAHHCLGGAILGDEDIEVGFGNGEVLPGRVHRCSPAADLALIDVPKSGSGPLIPRADRASRGDSWRNPYQPSPRHALLSGTVHAVPVWYECEGGDTVEAMQLGCAQDVRGYAGYSGSPIEGGGPDGEGRLFGVLIEQYPEQYPDGAAERPASLVLFAVTLSEVFRRFDCFDLGHLIASFRRAHGMTLLHTRKGAASLCLAARLVMTRGRASRQWTRRSGRSRDGRHAGYWTSSALLPSKYGSSNGTCSVMTRETSVERGTQRDHQDC
jgi:hypothetical protein